MTDLVVVTSLLGPGPDQLGPPPPAVSGVRYVCVTDRDQHLPDGWEGAPYTGPPGPPRLRARWVRAFVPAHYPEPVSLWLDASFDLLVSPRDFVEEYTRQGVDLLGFRHPQRQRMRDETTTIVRLGQISATYGAQIVSHYQAQGWDTDGQPQRALTCGGMLVRRATDRARAFGARWWEEISIWGERSDQLTLDFVAARVGLRIGYLDGNYACHPWVRYDWPRHTGIPA